MSNTVRAKNSQANDLDFSEDESSEIDDLQTGGADGASESAPTSDVDEINAETDSADQNADETNEHAKETA